MTPGNQDPDLKREGQMASERALPAAGVVDKARIAQARRQRLLKRWSTVGSAAAVGTLLSLTTLYAQSAPAHAPGGAFSIAAGIAGAGASSDAGAFFQGGGSCGGHRAYEFGSPSPTRAWGLPCAVTSAS